MLPPGFVDFSRTIVLQQVMVQKEGVLTGEQAAALQDDGVQGAVLMRLSPRVVRSMGMSLQAQRKVAPKRQGRLFFPARHPKVVEQEGPPIVVQLGKMGMAGRAWLMILLCKRRN